MVALGHFLVMIPPLEGRGLINKCFNKSQYLKIEKGRQRLELSKRCQLNVAYLGSHLELCALRVGNWQELIMLKSCRHQWNQGQVLGSPACPRDNQ